MLGLNEGGAWDGLVKNRMVGTIWLIILYLQDNILFFLKVYLFAFFVLKIVEGYWEAYFLVLFVGDHEG